jgi:hypothetical protein
MALAKSTHSRSHVGTYVGCIGLDLPRDAAAAMGLSLDVDTWMLEAADAAISRL